METQTHKNKRSKLGKVTRKVIQIGDSIGITFPKEYCDQHNIQKGQAVDFWYDTIFHGEPITEEAIRKKLGLEKEA